MRLARFMVVAVAAGLVAVAGVEPVSAEVTDESPLQVSWSVRLHGRVGDLAALPRGGVVAGGAIERSNPATSWMVGFLTRYRRDGTRVWTRTWRLGVGRWSPVTGLAVSPGGVIYATGFVYGGGGAGGQGVALLRTYSPQGRLLAQWSSRPRGRWFGDAARARWQLFPTGVAVSGHGARRLVVVSGYSYRLGDPFPERGWVRAFSGRLRPGWVHQVVVPRYRGFRDRADAVTVTGGTHRAVYLAGSVHTTRSRYGDVGNEDVVVQRLGTDGTTVWTRVLGDHAGDPADHDYANRIIATPRGPIVSGQADLAEATGWVPGVEFALGGRGWLGQWSSRGALTWRDWWATDTAVGDVATTAAGRTLAAGGTKLATRATVRLRAYAPDGRPTWTWTSPQRNRVGSALATRGRAVYLAETLSSHSLAPDQLNRSWVLRLRVG